MTDQMTDEDYYGRVRQLGLKPTSVATVWQTLDEQYTFSVARPSDLDEDEKLSTLETLEKLVRGWS